MEMHGGAAVAMNMMIVPALALILEKFVMIFHTQQLLEDFVPEKKNYAMRKL